MKKVFRRLRARIKRTFIADCPACHLHFYGDDSYGKQRKINKKHYRIVCHRCEKELKLMAIAS